MRQVSVDEIRGMLLGRRRLEEEGWGSRTLHAAVDGRQLHHVRRGWYLALRTWSELAPESRHRAEVVAADLAASGTRPVFSHASAAVLWGLPLYRVRPTRVHVTAPPDRRHSTSGILRHEGTVSPGDIVERDGIRCTSLARTVVDLARTVSPEAALAVADAALALVGGDPWEFDDTAEQALLADLAARVRRPRLRGIVQARRIVGLADGRAQLPLESVTRYRLHQLGFGRPRLQVPVDAPRGGRFWLDIAVDQCRTFVECDGRDKYLDDELRGERTAERVVLDEKIREDWVRGTTGWRVIRVTSADVASLATADAHFRAFGLFAR